MANPQAAYPSSASRSTPSAVVATRQRVDRTARAAAGVTVGLMAMAAAGIPLLLADRGFDRLDEAYYLTLISRPESIHPVGSVYLFGGIYHPLFVALGGDVTALRRVSWAVLIVLAAALGMLGYRVAAQIRGDHDGHDRCRSQALSGTVVGAAGVLPTAFFPASPSYNTLTFAGCAIFLVGCLLLVPHPSGDRQRWWAHTGAVMAAGGVALTVFGKPTSAVILSALLVVVVLGCGRGARTLGVVVISGAMWLLGLLWVAGLRPFEFIPTLLGGQEYRSRVGGHSLATMLGWDLQSLPPAEPILLLVPALAYGALLAARHHVRGDGWGSALPARIGDAWGRWSILMFVGLLVVGVLAVAMYARAFRLPVVSDFLLVLLWAVPLIFIVRFTSPWLADLKGRDPLAWVALVAALTPSAYVFGTDSNPVVAHARGAAFWILAGVLLCVRYSDGRSSARGVLVPLLALAAAATLVVSIGTAYRPYRYSPLPAARSPVAISLWGSMLMLDAGDAASSSSFRASLDQTSWQPDAPVIDLTGASPGYIFFMGGRPMGHGWLFVGHPTSSDAAAYALAQESCEDLSAAWVLVPVSKRPGVKWDDVTPALGSLGRDVERDYRQVASFTHVDGRTIAVLQPVGHPWERHCGTQPSPGVSG